MGLRRCCPDLPLPFSSALSFQEGTLFLTGLDIILRATLRTQEMRYPAIIGLTPIDKTAASCWAS
eukprot:6260635-Prorocentrum_lima.AAC.1